MDGITRVKQIILERFSRNISDEEAKDILDKTIKQTETLQSTVSGFSKSRYGLAYDDVSKLEIYFSPNAITDQVRRLVEEVGDKFETNIRYQHAREMTIASRFVIGLKKALGQEWMIKGQEAPDILLAMKNEKPWTKKPFNAIRLEIMVVPEIVKNKWTNNIENAFVDFISKTKFSKRYGKYTHLLILIRFTHKNLDLVTIQKKLSELKDNPYHQIWVMALTDPTGYEFMICLIYPDYQRTEINLHTEGAELVF